MSAERIRDEWVKTMKARKPSIAFDVMLTTGILDAVMISKAEKNRRVETPHLDIRYQPSEWGFATDALPRIVKR